jgi:hypothetical protein
LQQENLEQALPPPVRPGITAKFLVAIIFSFAVIAPEDVQRQPQAPKRH